MLGVDGMTLVELHEPLEPGTLDRHEVGADKPARQFGRGHRLAGVVVEHAGHIFTSAASCPPHGPADEGHHVDHTGTAQQSGDPSWEQDARM